MRRQIIGENKAAPAPNRGRRAQKDSGAPSGLPRFLNTSGGKPVEESVRRNAENAYGRDLKDVRIHTDDEAADALNARAFTSGRDIFFADGQYAPNSSDGRRLIAHELAHVVQQSNGTTPGVSQPADTFEQGADRAASYALRGESAPITASGAAPAIQREALPDLKPSPMLARAEGSGTIDSFATGSSTLAGGQKAEVDRIAANILSLRGSYPGCTVSLTGHTDAVGEEANNMTLGQARADAVRDELADSGVPPEIMLTDSAGETQLKVPTQAAEPRNRRVEIQFDPEGRYHFGLPELQLTPPQPLPSAPPPPPIFPPKLPPSFEEPHQETPAEAGKRIFAPIPPDPRKPAPGILAPVIDKIDSMMKRMGVSKLARDIVIDGAKAALVKAVTAPADAAMDQTSMNAEQKKAIHSIMEAAIKSITEGTVKGRLP